MSVYMILPPSFQQPYGIYSHHLVSYSSTDTSTALHKRQLPYYFPALKWS